MTECWLDSGFVTVTGRPPAAPSPAMTGSSTAGKRSTMAGDTSANDTASDSPAPARISRTVSRRRNGDGRYGGIGVCGRMSGMSS